MEPHLFSYPDPLRDPWFLSVFGWILYNVGKLSFGKHYYDLDDNGINVSDLKNYFRLNWIDMLFSLMLVPLIVTYSVEVWEWFTSYLGLKWKFTNLVYTFVGLWIPVLQYVAHVLREKFGKKS